MKIAIAAPAIAAALLSSMTASAQTIKHEDLIEGFTMAHLEALAGFEGLNIISKFDDDMLMVVENDENYRILLEARSCDENTPKTCDSMLMQVRFTDFTEVDPALVAKVSSDFIAAEAYFDEEKTLVIERYVLLRDGMTLKNLGYNILVLVEAYKAMRPFLRGEKPD